MELSYFEFGLHLFLPIYSRTIVIDRCSIFAALEEDFLFLHQYRNVQST